MDKTEDEPLNQSKVIVLKRFRIILIQWRYLLAKSDPSIGLTGKGRLKGTVCLMHVYVCFSVFVYIFTSILFAHFSKHLVFVFF